MPLPPVAPADVAAYAPDAPTVTLSTCEEASDWVQDQFDRAAVYTPGLALPEAGTRQARELLRGICAAALYFQARGKASTSRVTGAATGAVKKIVVGPIEVDQAVVDTESAAAGMVLSAAEWRGAVWRHLVAAGIPRPRLVVGASR